ncbi:uncharacterized protein LOC132699064 [Cylas formicarius]|uniref:uncharacterized protein LOC132699064 n=1 Tax=Cylas formicarius TaxID=197179 RepID=UPI0029583A71|nr:uncharacterized protein LOC132699064 [Cylas formicarius]
MKALFGTLVIVLVAFVAQSYANSCRTCRGSLCSEENVPLLECNRHLLSMPFQNSYFKQDEDASYGCLDLEYIEDQSSTTFQQCISGRNLDSFCKELSSSGLEIIRCNVVPAASNRKKRNTLIDADISSSSTETAPTTNTPTTNTPTTNTPTTNTPTTNTPTTNTPTTNTPTTNTPTTNAPTTNAPTTQPPSSPETEEPGTTENPNNSSNIYGLSLVVLAATLSIFFL